jgi:hypothetical protein
VNTDRPAAPAPHPARSKPVAPPPHADPAATPGHSFDHEVRLLYRITACTGDEPVPPPLASIVDKHCEAFVPLIDGYRTRYLERAGQFLATLQPPDLPTTVVYPFGGGDLLSALTTYPHLTEVTTLSLEHAGDPRRVESGDAASLEDSLEQLRESIRGLLTQSDSTSDNLMDVQRGQLPGQLAFFLVALAIHEQEPVGLRYFQVRRDGELHYLSEPEIGVIENELARRLNQRWTSPDFSVAFSNMELTFRPKGSAAGPLRVHRHIAANLMDGPLASDPGVIKYLEKYDRVTAMTKAASYTLWNPNFSRIRNYLLGHMAFMLSDSTGIPPRYIVPADFVQETYGTFAGPFLETNARDSDDFRALWRSQPERPLAFRYGYLDSEKHPHLLVTRKPRT